MIKIEDHTVADLDVLALKHYNALILVPLVGGINYHKVNSLIGRIRNQKRIDAADPIRTAFWDYLLNNAFTNLKRIITGRPVELSLIINEIEAICGNGFFSNDINYETAKLTDFGTIVKAVFNYSNYRSKADCRANCQELNLSYCPNCNEQVIQVIEIINGLTGATEQRALLQLDHFYPQVRHPYFSVSFFNLIPGCSVCNADLKGEKKFSITSHFNPFEKRFEDNFSFVLDTLLLSSIDDVNISYKNKSAHAENSLVDFKIIERYKNVAHRKVIFKMVNSFKSHSPKIQSSLMMQFKGLFTSNSRKEILLNNYNIPFKIEEINSVQLGKLKRDIAIQMEIFR